MHLKVIHIHNFRRLKDVLIGLDQELSVFVGANNSGKTSVAHALKMFTSPSTDRLLLHDFSVSTWAEIDAFGEGRMDVVLPSVLIDLWFEVVAADLHRVIDLLPNLNWQGSLVGIRIEFAATDPEGLRTRFSEIREQSRASIDDSRDGSSAMEPSPNTLSDYLVDNLQSEFSLKYFVLDYAQFDDKFVATSDYAPLEIKPDKGRSGRDVLNSIISIDFMQAQRFLSDSGGGSRAEELSRHLSRFYSRNLEKRGDDIEAILALTASEDSLNEHLATVFGPTLDSLAELGYPGLTNPHLIIKSALNPATIMSSQDGTQVLYVLGDEDGPTLPDTYNGLGFKNLIYMVVELLDLHAKWIEIEDKRPPLHLVFIEEPEAHLHAQLQQVFVRQVFDIITLSDEDGAHYANQMVLTTHSPHIIYERGFRPIRYFRREARGIDQATTVLNVSDFYAVTENPTRDFLERYLKLTHCDLFFADAAVLVEGNVERLLIPQMIETASPGLKKAYLSILEIGGAFGHRFQTLIEFLGITTLIVTDLDSVEGPAEEEEGARAAEDDEIAEHGAGKVCRVEKVRAVTSNQTLIQWLPSKTTIVDLQAATEDDRTQQPTVQSQAHIRVCYQTPVNVSWNGASEELTGRTLEEAFVYENLTWCQHTDRQDLKLRIARSETFDLNELTERLHKRIKGSSFKKTDFALALLMQPENTWTVPAYIREGLSWLENAVVPDNVGNAPDATEVEEV